MNGNADESAGFRGAEIIVILWHRLAQKGAGMRHQASLNISALKATALKIIVCIKWITRQIWQLYQL